MAETSTIQVPEANDSWAQVELYRWQYGELPTQGRCRPLNVSEGLRNMANALSAGAHKDATPEAREGMPSPFNVFSVMLYTAKLLEDKITEGIASNDRFTRRYVKQTGRNMPCKCGSGKKFKKCCLFRQDGKGVAC